VSVFERPDLKAAAAPAFLERGCVHVIGLEPVRDRAGARWGKIREGVYSRLETILRKRLGPSDFFVALDEVSYLVTMPAAESVDAQTACLGAAYELYENYLGQCDIGTIKLYRAQNSDDEAIVIDRIASGHLQLLAERAGIRDTQTKRDAKGAYGAAPNEPALLDAGVQFLPMWDARKEAITLYFCVPHKIVFGNAVAVAVALDDLTAKARAKVELACLKEGIAILARHLKQGERFLMGFDVAYGTLNSHITRMEFTAACRALSAQFRQYIAIQITDVPEGVPQTRLGDLVTVVKPYARAVMCRAPRACRNYAPFQGTGLQAIGLDVSRPKLSPQETDAEIGKFAAAAKRIPIPTYLTGVADSAVLKSARQAGAHFLLGPAIAPLTAQPRPVMRLYWAEVMQAAERAA
jgi:hypothetical protein